MLKDKLTYLVPILFLQKYCGEVIKISRKCWMLITVGFYCGVEKITRTKNRASFNSAFALNIKAIFSVNNTTNFISFYYYYYFFFWGGGGGGGFFVLSLLLLL